MTPLISIVIAAYNAEKFLPLTLESVLNQTFQQWECVVVDDGSSDNTFNIAKQYTVRDKRFRALTQSNAGPAVARNFGAQHCSPEAEYINFSDSDDLFHPDALEKLLASLIAYPEFIGSHGLADQIDEHNKPVSPGEFASYCRSRLGFDGKEIVVMPLDYPTNLAILANCFLLAPPGVALIRRQYFDEIDGFDISYRRAGGEDWDFFNRLAQIGDLFFIDHVLVDYRRYSHSATANSKAMHALGHRAKRELFFSPKNTPQQQYLLKRAYKAWQLYKYQEKRALMLESYAQKNVKRYLIYAAHAVGHLLFRLRGYPSANG